MNYFSPETAAARYARGRPDFHSNTIGRIREKIGLEQKVTKALDVACGTGLSTKALLEIAEEVFGTDTSKAMLAHAPEKDRIQYSIAPAEQQPFPDHTFDLITVCSGVHWFQIDKFLAESARILKSHGWLVLYENHFIADMDGHPEFKNWFQDRYLKQFPSPPRHNDYSWNNDHLNPQGWELIGTETFTNPIRFNKKELILYFSTQSNIIAATEQGRATYAEAEAWLNDELSPLFPNNEQKKLIHYGNWIKYLRKVDK
jgi:ubiquinone/menaquinone biosynthesis C-methylase UbiE